MPGIYCTVRNGTFLKVVSKMQCGLRQLVTITFSKRVTAFLCVLFFKKVNLNMLRSAHMRFKNMSSRKDYKPKCGVRLETCRDK